MITLKKTLKQLDKFFFLQHVDAKPLFVSGIVRGFVDGLKIREYSLIICFYKKGTIEWVTFDEDCKFLFKKILELHNKDNDYWRKTIDLWRKKKKKKVEKTFNKLKNKKLKNLSDNELLKDMELFFNNQIEARRVSSLIDAFYFLGGPELIKLLSEFSEINVNEAFTILTAHESESFLNRAEKELLKIAKLMPHTLKKKKKLTPKIRSLIKKYLDKFSWVKTTSFSGGKEYTANDVIRDINNLIKEKKKKRYNVTDNIKKRKEFIKKYKFNKEIIALSDLSVLFTYWQDLRKENSIMTTYLATKYIKEISKRKRISVDDLSYLDFWELKKQMKHGFEKTLKERKNGVILIFKKKKIKTYLYKEAKEIVNKILKSEKIDVNELKGMCASKGKAIGKAKILMRMSDMKKIKIGDILIAPTTRPEHLPGMKKSAAIITDEGGITSHAAIVSRELGIPCIIGTKIATKVLKDGDYVEVDANKGVVRKIK